MPKILILMMCFVASTMALIETWWNVGGTKFNFDSQFRKNVHYQDSLPGKSYKQKRLIEYFKYNKINYQQLLDHNSKTDFHPKHLQERVIIPHLTHFMWITSKENKKVLNRTNIWKMVHAMGIENKKYGSNWQHYFWTNDASSIAINETVCEGRCHIKLFSELPDYNRFSYLVEQLIDVKFYAIDFLKPIFVYHFGGLYADTDYQYVNSIRFMHSVMDFYSSDEGQVMSGVCAGVFGARKYHEAMKDWIDLLFGYYGIASDVFGAKNLMPMPAFRDDLSWTSGPRSISFAVWNNLNKWGNNDCIWKMTMMDMDSEHFSWKYQKFYGDVIDDSPRTETITIGGQKYYFEQFGFQVNLGSWHVPGESSFKLEDGRTQQQYWLMDMGDRKDILRPNYVTNETLESDRERYSDSPIAGMLYYDEWFPAYFKMQTGRYFDNMKRPQQQRNHGEMLGDQDEYDANWFHQTNENMNPAKDEFGEYTDPEWEQS